MRRHRRATHRLRQAVDALPRRTREAMLRGIDGNRIVVGAYVDPRTGGICPMLAAHRNGGRASVASLARAWDAYTGARRPRLATRREVRTLRSLLEQSLYLEGSGSDGASIAQLAAQIRAEREQFARCTTSDAPAAGEGDRDPRAGDRGSDDRASDRRDGARGPDLDLLAIAEAALAEAGTWARTEAEEREPVSPG